MNKKIVMPIPRRDFDPSEVAITWKVLKKKGFLIEFATPAGNPGEGDPFILTGRGLDPWGWIPGLARLPLIGLLLRARKDARCAYDEMLRDAAFQEPQLWRELKEPDFDGLVLPGGHWARGMKEYLESKALQSLVVAFFHSKKPIAAVCHGVLLAARSIDPQTGRSVLYGRKTTALTWKLEKSAASVARFTRFWDPYYYRTYRESPEQPAGYMGVQQEVTRALAAPSDFLDVPRDLPGRWKKASGFFRDHEDDQMPGWVVRDGNYVSARWPGDLYTLTDTFADLFKV
jgi:putative intracellular protease/amidase